MKKKWIIPALCMVLLMMAVMLKLYVHEKWQSNKIHSFDEEVVGLENNLEMANEEMSALKSNVKI